LACLSDRHQVEAPRLIRTAPEPGQVGQYSQGVDFPIVAKPLDERLSGRFIIAMQGQFEMSFGLQYSPNVVVCYAAHVIGCCDRATIAAPVSDIATSICQFCRLGITWKPYLVSPENKQRIELAFGVVEALGKKARFRPARVRLFGHTIREHHATGERGLNYHLLP
jgi:hypothetical protein